MKKKKEINTDNIVLGTFSAITLILCGALFHFHNSIQADSKEEKEKMEITKSNTQAMTTAFDLEEQYENLMTGQSIPEATYNPDELKIPPHAQDYRRWAASNPNLRCEGVIQPIKINTWETNYLDTNISGWRTEEARIANLLDAASRTDARYKMSFIRIFEQTEVALKQVDPRVKPDIQNMTRGNLQLLREQITRCEDADQLQEERATLYLTGLRRTQANRPAQALNLSDEPRRNGLSDREALCLSGTYDLKLRPVIAGTRAVSPTGSVQAFGADHPGLRQLGNRLITPADLKAAGCTTTRQAELFARISD